MLVSTPILNLFMENAVQLDDFILELILCFGGVVFKLHLKKKTKKQLA